MGKVKSGKKIYESLRKALRLADNLPLERAAEAADPEVLNKVDQLLMDQGIDPKSIGTYEDKIKTLITKPDAYAEYRKTLNEVYGNGGSRSEEAGFGKQDWFHGTTVPIDEFKKDALGLSTNAQSAKKGFFFAGDAPTAGNYADLAADKGVIREGDKITTRSLSETADLHNEAYDKAKDLQFEISMAIQNNMRQSERNRNTWRLIRQIEQRADPQEMAERLPELKEKIKKGDAFIEANELKTNQLANEIKSINDKIYSQGQNVLPVKLRAGDGKVHVKDYKGQGYRDTTYADEMTKAQEKGNSGVLFKNTYDPANPNNRVKQNIAAVFEPEQIRSKFAAFDPALNKSKWIMAGAAGATMTMLPEESEASMGKFNSLKKMWQVGDKTFPAANAAEALKVQKAMEAQGMVEPGRALVQADAPTPVANKTLPNMARGMAVAPGFESGSDVLRSGFKGLKDAFGTYRENVVEPVANKLKETLTPKLNVQGQQYDTASPVSDMALDIAADPLTYAGGGAGAGLGALDMATSFGEESPKRNYEGLKAILNKK